MNTFELNARANKTDKLVDYLQSVAATVNAKHKRCVIRASDIVDMLCQWGEVQWAQVAKEAHVPIPSRTTRGKVIREFQKLVKFS